MGDIVEAAGMFILTRSQPAQFLLLKHNNRWDLPKGHIDPGEDLLTAALRETEEETGIGSQQVEVDDQFRFVIEYPVQSSKRGAYHKRVTYFLGYVDSVKPIHLTEHIGYQWFGWPARGSIQAATIDPLLQALTRYLNHDN
ncbi:MAG: NUDIX domain-containing protein [Pirellulaceae bacterium]|nr:NUDIX domain-containing protein [Pirellulaceae bacterium]